MSDLPKPQKTADEWIAQVAGNHSEPDANVVLTTGNDTIQGVLSDTLTYSGKPGTMFALDGDDHLTLKIDKSAYGDQEIHMGKGNDTLVLQTEDPNAKIRKLENGTIEYIQQLGSTMAKLVIHDAEHVTVERPNTPAQTLESPDKSTGR